ACSVLTGDAPQVGPPNTYWLPSCDPLLDEIAERWFAQKVPDQEPDRRILEEGREVAKARIADLYAARYQRGEFSTADELATYEHLMRRLREQRDAAEAALDNAAEISDALPARTRPPPGVGLQHGQAVGRPGRHRLAWRGAALANGESDGCQAGQRTPRRGDPASRGSAARGALTGDPS